jgi:hypothetical protein
MNKEKKGHSTPWNIKLSKYAGKYVPCSEFQKNGLDSEGYRINEDGSLTFVNYLRSLNAAIPADYKNYWSSKEKAVFLKLAKETE